MSLVMREGSRTSVLVFGGEVVGVIVEGEISVVVVFAGCFEDGIAVGKILLAVVVGWVADSSRLGAIVSTSMIFSIE